MSNFPSLLKKYVSVQIWLLIRYLYFGWYFDNWNFYERFSGHENQPKIPFDGIYFPYIIHLNSKLGIWVINFYFDYIPTWMLMVKSHVGILFMAKIPTVDLVKYNDSVAVFEDKFTFISGRKVGLEHFYAYGSILFECIKYFDGYWFFWWQCDIILQMKKSREW